MKDKKTLKKKIDEFDRYVDWFYSDDFQLDEVAKKYQVAVDLAKDIQNDLAELKKVAYVFLGIEDETYDYVYKVKIDELVGKEFKKELLTDYNWILSKDDNLILLYF